MVVKAEVVKQKKARRVSQAQVNGAASTVHNGQLAEELTEKVSKDVLVVAQEVKIVQLLACNDLIKRNRQMRRLSKWLQLRSRSTFTFSEEDFLRIWKGLYYHMWLSDKPRVQEDLAEEISKLLHCFEGNVELSVKFFGAFLETMCHQWLGIDQWRMDKFLMLVRRMVRHMLRVLKAAKWSVTAVQCFNDHMSATVLSEDTIAIGLVMHFLDVFVEELAKVAQGDISAEQVGALLRPFVAFMGTQRDGKLISHCRTRVFYHLLYQSGLGREYNEKYNAWKAMGFPSASINALELDDEATTDATTEEDGGEAVEQATGDPNLDPRAGDVDVFMPELPLDGKYIIDAVQQLLNNQEMRTKCRNMLRKLLAVFETYQRGEFPLGVKTMPRFEAKSEVPLVLDKIAQLESLENEMFATGRKLKQLNKRKRRKLLQSLNYEDVDESNFEQTIERAIPKKYVLMERRKRAQAAVLTGWHEEDISDDTTATVSAPPRKKKKKIKKTAAGKVSTSEVIALSNGDATKTPPVADVTISEKADTEPKAKKNKGTIQESDTDTSLSKKKSLADAWATPPVEGEVEYFIPSRKLQLRQARGNLVRNPLAVTRAIPARSTPSQTEISTPRTPASAAATPSSSSKKRVKIALKNNTAQNPSEYLQQVKNSPDLPYDAHRKPGKGLLKPNAMPSPINPFYKKKIGLRLFNDTP